MPFYKLSEGGLLCAPNFVHAPGYSLISDQKDTYTYPVDGWTWYDTQEAAYLATGLVSITPPLTAITKLAFRSRFTQAEKVRIEIAQLDISTATLEERSFAAALRATQQDLAVAKYIDLARAETRAGVISLETYGLLDGAGRALQILDAPIQPDERP